MSSYLLVFCERVGAWGIPMGGCLVWVVGLLGDAGLFFPSLVLRLANADFFFLFCSAKVMAVMMCLVVLRALVPAALPRFEVPWLHGRWIWIEVVSVASTNRCPERLRKINSTLRVFVVIFLYFRDLL